MISYTFSLLFWTVLYDASKYGHIILRPLLNLQSESLVSFLLSSQVAISAFGSSNELVLVL